MFVALSTNDQGKAAFGGAHFFVRYQGFYRIPDQDRNWKKGSISN